MLVKSKNRLQWILSGTLTAGLALAPALVASANAQQNSGTGQPAPTAGTPGNWGPAGPPPDAQNGQIPPPDNSAQGQNQGAGDQPPGQVMDQGSDQGSDQSSDQGPSQYPGVAPNQQAPNGSASPAPAAGAGVGYGQAPRPAYQRGQNQGYNQGQNQGYNQGQNQGYNYQTAPSAIASGPVTLSSGVLIPVRTSEPLDSKKVKPGEYFEGIVAQNVYAGNVLAIPRGAQVTGRIVDVKKAGELKGGASLSLQLTTLNLGGNSYALATDIYNTTGPGKGGYTAGNTVGTAALGAVIGAIAGGGPGAAIGAVAGTGVGLGASAATPGPRSVLPPEAVVTFHLTTPATVQPLSPRDAQQLAGGAGPEGQQGYQDRRYPPAGYAQGPGYGPGYGYYAPYPGPVVYGYPYGYGRPYPYYYGRRYYYGRYR